MSVTPLTAEESANGNQYMQFNIQAINGYNPPAGTTVGYTITGDWEFGDIQVIGINIGDGNNISEPFPLIESPENPYSDVFRIGEQGLFKTAAIRVYATGDAIHGEGSELVTVTLAPVDSLGNSTSSTEISVGGIIIDETPTPTAAPTMTPTPTAAPAPTPIPPTPTPTTPPTPPRNTEDAAATDGEWSIFVRDNSTEEIIQPIIVDISEGYGAAEGTYFYKYFPVAVGELINVSVQQHTGTLQNSVQFTSYSQRGEVTHTGAENDAPMFQMTGAPNTAFNIGASNYTTFIDNKMGTDVLPALTYVNELALTALNTDSEEFIIGRKPSPPLQAEKVNDGGSMLFWVGPSNGSVSINIISIPENMKDLPTTYEELRTPPGQDTSNLTFDYHVPLTLDGYTYGLQNENGDSFGYYEDYSLTVANPVYWSHEIFAEPYEGHQWTSTDQLVFEVDGNQIVPDGTIQNNISIVTQIESDGRLSILTKSHNINEDRVHEIRITGGPKLVDGSTPIDPSVRRPMLGLTSYNTWMDLVAQWEQANPGCEYDPNFDHVTGSFLQNKLGVTNTEMFDWGLGTSGRKRFMLRVLSETTALDMDLLNEFGQSESSGCLT